jgi:hypothetical protein
VRPGHLGRDAALVDEDQPGRIGAGQLVLVGRPLPGDIFPALLAGPERLFLRPSPSRLSALQIIGADACRPVRASNAAAYSASVALSHPH